MSSGHREHLRAVAGEAVVAGPDVVVLVAEGGNNIAAYGTGFAAAAHDHALHLSHALLRDAKVELATGAVELHGVGTGHGGCWCGVLCQ